MTASVSFESDPDLDIASSFAVSLGGLLDTTSRQGSVQADSTGHMDIFEDIAWNQDGPATSEPCTSNLEALDHGVQPETDCRAKAVNDRRKDARTSSKANKARKKRFRLNHSQTRFLMNEFARQAHPDAAHRARLSKEIPGLSPRQVQVWFQNRRAKLKRLALEDRERTLRSQKLQGIEAAAAAAEAAAAYGCEATFQDPRAATMLAAGFPTQQPLFPVHNLDQYMTVPYGYSIDEFDQSPLSLETRADPAFGEEFVSLAPPQRTVYPFAAGSVAAWEPLYASQSQQLQPLPLHGRDSSMQSVPAHDLAGGEGGLMSACDPSSCLHKEISDGPFMSWTGTNSTSYQQCHPPSVSKTCLTDANRLMSELQDQLDQRGYCSEGLNECNWLLGASHLTSSLVDPAPLEASDAVGSWSGETNPIAPMDTSVTPNFTYFGGLVPSHAEPAIQALCDDIVTGYSS